MRSLSLAALVLATAAAAQDPVPVPVQYATVSAVPVGPPGPDLPPPPRNLFEGPPGQDTPPLPIVESAVPAPDDPPAVLLREGVDNGGDYVVFRNTNVKPSGTSTSNVGEPDVQLADASNGLFTGNWHASRTTDGGASWTRINPYTRFPASYGGFCCDQRVITAGGVTVWLLQYVKDSSGNNTQRIAVATSAANLGADNFSHRWDITAQTFGYASGNWLDFPDAAVSDDHFYFASNVFTNSGSYAGAVFWRSSRSNVAAGGNLQISYINSPASNSVGGSFRFTRGATTTMFVGTNLNTSTIRVFRWDTAGGVTRVDRTISTWSSGLAADPGPDGLGLTGRPGNNRIHGAFVSETEMGFAFHVAPRGSIPHNHIRLVRLDLDRNLIGERNIWFSTTSCAFPALVTNAWGHVGLIAAIGGGTYYPSTMTMIDDDLETFSTGRIFASSNSGPSGDRWGDYYTVSRHPSSTLYGTFYGSGMRQSGGSANSNSVPEFVHFGRAAFGDPGVGLIVRSSPISGVAVTLTPNDSSGQGGGSTPFYRGYSTSAAYSLVAPATHTSGSTLYLFHRWATKIVANTPFVEQPIGATTVSVSSIGSIDDLAEARYLRSRVLTIQSTNPASGVQITLTPADFNGGAGGPTPFARQYKDTTQVTCTAPAVQGCNPFRRWVVDSTPQPLGQLSVTVTMDRDVLVVAEYSATTLGSVSNLGNGCPGASGIVPVHSIAHPNGSCGPQQGSRLTYDLSRASARTPAVLLLGLSSRSFGAFRLPLDLGVAGVTGCNLYHDLVVTEGYATDSLGAASRVIVWPVSASSVGVHIFSSWAITDPNVRRPTPITMSNALDLVQGGLR